MFFKEHKLNWKWQFPMKSNNGRVLMIRFKIWILKKKRQVELESKLSAQTEKKVRDEKRTLSKPFLELMNYITQCLYFQRGARGRCVCLCVCECARTNVGKQTGRETETRNHSWSKKSRMVLETWRWKTEPFFQLRTMWIRNHLINNEKWYLIAVVMSYLEEKKSKILSSMFPAKRIKFELSVELN